MEYIRDNNGVKMSVKRSGIDSASLKHTQKLLFFAQRQNRSLLSRTIFVYISFIYTLLKQNQISQQQLEMNKSSFPNKNPILSMISYIDLH